MRAFQAERSTVQRWQLSAQARARRLLKHPAFGIDADYLRQGLAHHATGAADEGVQSNRSAMSCSTPRLSRAFTLTLLFASVAFVALPYPSFGVATMVFTDALHPEAQQVAEDFVRSRFPDCGADLMARCRSTASM